MTDAPSQHPEKPAAPESADAETPNQGPATAAGPIPEQSTGPRSTEAPQAPYGRANTDARTPASGPTPTAGAAGWSSAPVWQPMHPVRVAGWEWSAGWVPKPGIIALRPQQVGDLFRGVFALLRGYWRTVLTMTFLAALAAQLATQFITTDDQQNTDDLRKALSSPNADPAVALRQSLKALSGLVGGIGAIGAIDLLVGVLVTAALTVVISRAVLGRPAPLAAMGRELRNRVPNVLGLMVVSTLLVGGAMALAAAPVLIAYHQGASDSVLSPLSLLLLPGGVLTVWIAVTINLAAPALILERQGIRAALTRSARLVRGAWWRVLGINVLVAVATAIAGVIMAIPFSIAQLIAGGLHPTGPDSTPVVVLAIISGTVGSTLTLPFASGVTVLLYMDQRIRREALDLELAAAAGVPGYEDPAARL